jgi:hypothetical protein
MPAKPALTIESLLSEAAEFSVAEGKHAEPKLFGVDNGKTVGTYLEQKFVAHLLERYSFAGGNSALGIDIPSVEVDIKVTSIRQPQSSCPFRSVRQKIFGLGYNLVVFVYAKTDNPSRRTASLNIEHTVFVEKSRTADYQLTRGIREILERDANEDDLVALFQDKNLPVDEIEARNIAREVLKKKPEQGYLTISNAQQWRLQYGRAIQRAGEIDGLERVA